MGAAAFIIAEYVNVAYIEVVKAAIIPAVVSYGALFYVTHLEACKLGLRRLAPEEVPSLKKTIKDGWYFFIPLGMLLIELLLFRHSPELAAFRTILVLQAVMFLRTLYDFAFQKKPILSVTFSVRYIQRYPSFTRIFSLFREVDLKDS